MKKARTNWKKETRVLEVLVEPACQLEHKSLSYLADRSDLLVALVERDGEVVIPHPAMRIQAGDMLTVLAGAALSEEQLMAFLEMTKGP